jgi:hypothetical protein
VTIGLAFGAPLGCDCRRMSRAIAVRGCAARLYGIEFLEGIFLPDQAGELGKRIFAAPNPGLRRSLMRLRLRLPVAPGGPVHGMFPHFLPIDL